jgi:hypothetical protein
MTDIGHDQDKVHWRRSSYTGANNNCVEFAVLAGRVGVRDSKNPARGTMYLTSAQWRAFVEVVKRGGPCAGAGSCGP